MSYQELINVILPYEPFSYPAYRRQFDSNQNISYILNKAKDFKIDVSPLINFKSEPMKTLVNPYTYNSSFRKVYEPYKQGRQTFYSDEEYLK